MLFSISASALSWIFSDRDEEGWDGNVDSRTRVSMGMRRRSCCATVVNFVFIAGSVLIKSNLLFIVCITKSEVFLQGTGLFLQQKGDLRGPCSKERK